MKIQRKNKIPKTKFGVCDYHLCDKKTKLKRCKHCNNFYCDEHFLPKSPMSFSEAFRANKNVIDTINLERKWRSSRHPCAPYREIESKKRIEDLEKKWNILDKLKSSPKLVPEPIIEKRPMKMRKVQKKLLGENSYAKRYHTVKELNHDPNSKPYGKVPISETSPIKIRPSTLVIVIVVSLLALVTFYFYKNPEHFNKILQSFSDIFVSITKNFGTTTSTTIYPTSTTILAKENVSLVPLIYQNNHWDHMPLEVFIDIDSGKKFPTFDMTTGLNNIRNAMLVWERKTNETVRFTEVNNEDAADIVVKWTAATYETPGETWKTMGLTSIYVLPEDGYHIITHADIDLTLSPIECHNTLTLIHEFGHALGLDHAKIATLKEGQFEVYDIMWTGGPCTGEVTTAEATTLIGFYEAL